MAPIISATHPTARSTALSPDAPVQTSAGFAGEEFSNNLFSDLAPLLTLFGEQVTKQFLSMSMGWADNILLGVGPLGIITTIVSAIRVAGVRNLKALIGRARESPATVEQEVLSSTSDHVCELWNGSEIVRQLGKPKTKEFIVYSRKNKPIQLADLEGAVSNGWLVETGKLSPTSDKDSKDNGLRQLSRQAPNLTLNVDQATASNLELRLWTIFGVTLHCITWIMPALVTYHWKWSKGLVRIQGYAYPCFLLGSCLVTVGVILCSHVIEATTKERTFAPAKEKTKEDAIAVFRLQVACTVGDQYFPTCIIFNSAEDRSLRTSRLKPNSNKVGSLSRFRPSLSTLAGFSSFLTICGFILQFIGLRALHWTATIMQLGVTLIMTGVRSWVRRGLAHSPNAFQINADLADPDQLALQAGRLCKRTLGDCPNVEGLSWRIITGTSIENIREAPWVFLPFEFTHDRVDSLPEIDSDTDPYIVIRSKLGDFISNDPLVHIAKSLEKALLTTLEIIRRSVSDYTLILAGPLRNIHWHHLVSVRSSAESTSETYRLRLSCSRGLDGWKVPPNLYCVLSLWYKSLAVQFTSNQDVDPFEGKNIVRLMGSVESFDRSLKGALHYLNDYSFLFQKIGEHLEVSGTLPTFGLAMLAQERREVENPRTDWHPGSDTLTELYSTWYQTPTPGHFNPDTACLVSYSRVGVRKEMALEIFSGFLSAIARTTLALRPINAPVNYECDDNNFGLFGYTVLARISEGLIASGIADTLKDANTVVFPPFLIKRTSIV